MGIVTTIAPIALALLMLGLGASLTFQDFLRVFKNPKDFFIGFVCQLIILPLVAYSLIIILKVPIELALGVMLIAAAPGGVTSNVLTKFADQFIKHFTTPASQDICNSILRGHIDNDPATMWLLGDCDLVGGGCVKSSQTR